MDAVDDDDDDQPPVKNDSIAAAGYADDAPKHPKPKIPEKTKQSNEQYINIASKADGQQQDDWEEFEDVNSKYEQLRAKFAAGANGNDDDDDDYYDEENTANNNDNNNDTTGDREQQKDKPVWKINRAEQEEQPPPSEPVAEPPKVEEPKPAPASTGAYRPPQMRGGSSVTVVSGATPQRVSKKKEPNLASTDEFPTLGATVNRK